MPLALFAGGRLKLLSLGGLLRLFSDTDTVVKVHSRNLVRVAPRVRIVRAIP